MTITAPFRSTPQLGPDINSTDSYYWFQPPASYSFSGSTANDDGTGASYKVGNVEKGTDGHDYIMLKNDTGSSLAAEARFNVADDGTFKLTTNATGAWMVPDDTGAVADGAYFQGKRYAL